ncbi:MAG: sensor histidine kinase, partial [Puniceicoccales bacterium]
NFSRKARLALAAGPVIVFLIDNWKLLEVSGVIELPFAAFYALSQFNLLLVIVGIAAVIFTFTRETLTQRQQAEQQAYSSRRLVANLSHELKTPITAILTTAQSMLRHERTSDKYKQALALCERNSRSMSHLIRRMLDLLDASPTSMGPALVDLDPRQILEACVELHAPLAMEKNVSLLMVCPKGHVIRTDADLLSIMLNNLVANAIRYTPSGKAVTLRFYHQPDKPATIRVSDQGPGIPKDALPHIFEAFYRVDRSSDRINGNYGLGLALTAQIAERIGAQLTVESDEESGALFCIQFPTSD